MQKRHRAPKHMFWASKSSKSSKNGFVVKFYCVPKPNVNYNSPNPEYDYRFIVYEPDLNGNNKTEFGLNMLLILI